MISEVWYPLCGVCDKKVDHVTVLEDWLHDRKIVMVFCHGEREVMCIDNHMLRETILTPGEAFNSNRLTYSKTE